MIPEWAMIFCRRRKVKLSVKQCLEDYKAVKNPCQGCPQGAKNFTLFDELTGKSSPAQ